MPFSMPRRRIYRRPLTTEDSDPEIQESQDSQAASLLRSETDNLSIFDYDDESSDVYDDSYDDERSDVYDDRGTNRQNVSKI